MEATDSAVIAASLEDPSSFGILFDRYAAVLLRFLVRRVDPSDAEELLGDVFRIAFERRSSFDQQWDCARPWLYGIATNLVAKHRRSEARRFKATLRLAARRTHDEDPAEQATSKLDASELWPRITTAFEGLTAGERDALLLFVWEELSYDEIASALGVPVGTVRSRLNRGRARLRQERQDTTEEHPR